MSSLPDIVYSCLAWVAILKKSVFTEPLPITVHTVVHGTGTGTVSVGTVTDVRKYRHSPNVIIYCCYFILSSGGII